MDKLELKQRIIRKAFEAYEQTIEMHRATEQDMTSDTLDAENDANEMSDDSNKLETLDDVEQLAEIIDDRQDELMHLDSMIPTLHEEVTIGAVIKTNQRCFFVAESIPEFEVEGVTYTGISSKAPIYKAMEGKKAGEKVSFREVEYKIEDVF